MGLSGSGEKGRPRRGPSDGSGKGCTGALGGGESMSSRHRVTRTGVVPIQAEGITHLTVNPGAYTSLCSAFGETEAQGG